MNNHYEIWSKAGKGPGFSVENPMEYIQQFNWVKNWFLIYFFNKVFEYILLILFILMVTGILFRKELFEKSNFKINYFKDHLLIYLSLLSIFFIWFFNFPTLRYAGFLIVFLIIIYPFIFFLDKKNKIE